eukprot:2095761-Lingulodinium_polyedra.AAC.1
MVLGPVADAVDQLCTAKEQNASNRLRCMPVVTLADQEKAFERMRHEWLWHALSRWGLPAWALEVADRLARGRT